MVLFVSRGYTETLIPGTRVRIRIRTPNNPTTTAPLTFKLIFTESHKRVKLLKIT